MGESMVQPRHRPAGATAHREGRERPNNDRRPASAVNSRPARPLPSYAANRPASAGSNARPISPANLISEGKLTAKAVEWATDNGSLLRSVASNPKIVGKVVSPSENRRVNAH